MRGAGHFFSFLFFGLGESGPLPGSRGFFGLGRGIMDSSVGEFGVREEVPWRRSQAVNGGRGCCGGRREGRARDGEESFGGRLVALGDWGRGILGAWTTLRPLWSAGAGSPDIGKG